MKQKHKRTTPRKKKASIRMADRRGRFLDRHTISDALAEIRTEYYEKKVGKKN